MGIAASDPDPRKREYDKKLIFKTDLHLLVPFALLNFLSLMGRTNIGAALIQKLPQDLHLDAMAVASLHRHPGRATHLVRSLHLQYTRTK